MDITSIIINRFIHKISRIISFLLSIAVLVGCTTPPLAELPLVLSNPDGSNGINLFGSLSNQSGEATPTPTPFQPLPPTAVFIPTYTPIPTATLEPTLDPQSVFNYDAAPQPPLPQPPGQLNILLLGSDARPGSRLFRTDTVILVTINTQMGTVNLTSFPRDLYINIPGVGANRINTAWQNGGFEKIAQTFQHNFGVRPDHYVLINFSSFKRIIDSLGGLDVQVGQSLSDYRAGYYVTIPAGSVYMDADTVLWYVRSRKTTNDFARNQRQQEILQAIFNKLVNMDAVRRAPEFYSIYKDSVMTDLSLANILPLLPVAARVAESRQIQHFFVGPGQVSNWITPGGAMVLLPDMGKVQNTIRKSQNIP